MRSWSFLSSRTSRTSPSSSATMRSLVGCDAMCDRSASPRSRSVPTGSDGTCQLTARASSTGRTDREGAMLPARHEVGSRYIEAAGDDPWGTSDGVQRLLARRSETSAHRFGGGSTWRSASNGSNTPGSGEIVERERAGRRESTKARHPSDDRGVRARVRDRCRQAGRARSARDLVLRLNVVPWSMAQRLLKPGPGPSNARVGLTLGEGVRRPAGVPAVEPSRRAACDRCERDPR